MSAIALYDASIVENKEYMFVSQGGYYFRLKVVDKKIGSSVLKVLILTGKQDIEESTFWKEREDFNYLFQIKEDYNV